MPTDSSAPSERRRGLLHGRRKGPKLSARQAQLHETLLPWLRLQLQPGADPLRCFSPPPCGEVEKSEGFFGRGWRAGPPQGGKEIDDVWLEVGFGAGEHLLWQAQNHPGVGLIGAEPYEGGVAKLLSRIDSLSPGSGGEGRGEGVSAPRSVSTPPHLALSPIAWGRGNTMTNIRLHEGDAREIVDALPDACLGRVFILFPDPWPKTRHHKRRFVQSAMLDALARVMKPGAELRFATDDKTYLVWALERLVAHPGFEWMAERALDWMTRPPDWPPTRYEIKAIRGRPTFLRFRRSDRICP